MEYKENWKQIPGFENYLISDEGRIWTKNYNRFVKLHHKKGGYLEVELWKDRRPHYRLVHRLVAETFIPKIPEDIDIGRDIVDHIDGDVSNNCVTNLRWCTIKENNNFDLHRKRISDALKDKPKSEIHKQKISKANTGRTYTEETHRLWSEQRKGGGNSRALPVVQYTLDMEFVAEYPCIRDAEIAIRGKVTMGNIYACCRGTRKTAYGYIWKYREE